MLEELGQSQEDVNQQIADADQQKEELIQQLCPDGRSSCISAELYLIAVYRTILVHCYQR